MACWSGGDLVLSCSASSSGLPFRLLQLGSLQTATGAGRWDAGAGRLQGGGQAVKRGNWQALAALLA
jgi:hypothetical protein